MHLRPAGRLPAGGLALLLLGALIAAALTGLLGGTPSEKYYSDMQAAGLVVELPTTLRSGVFFEANISVTAHARLADATVAMPASLWRSITINTQMPQPLEEEYKNGYFQLHFGPLDPGESIEIKLDAQINPDLFAGNHGEVVLFDGTRAVARVPVRLRVLP